MDGQGRLGAAGERLRKHIGKVLWGLAGLVALYIAWSVAGCAGCDGAPGLWVAVAVLLLCVAGHFVHAFTRNLPLPKADLGGELRAIFIYGYLVQGVALVTGLLLLIGAVGWVPEGKLGGLVYGCQASERGYGSELAACSDTEPVRQWLLHVGSRSEGPFEGKAEKDLLDHVDEACDGNDEDGTKAAISEAIATLGGAVGQGVVSVVAVACRGADVDRRTRIKEALLTNEVVSKQNRLRGGLIVPLYVVVLSLMGAAVGMSRRLPEIQRQAAHSVQSTGKGISPIVARERVVFQIMQVLAAPLIAVTAFATLEPDTVTAAALIGFTSGFASEVVLVKLRQASEALTRGSKSGA